MQTDASIQTRASWPTWAEFLRRHGLESLAAWALEAAGPLNLVGAQLLYFGGPLLRPVFSHEQFEAFAGLLESEEEAHAFAAFLREDGTP